MSKTREHVGADKKPPTRRQVLKGAAAGAAATLLPAPAVWGASTLKLGYVSPQTGPLAPFAEADGFVLGEARKAFKDGIKAGSRTLPVEILIKDSQSNPSRAAEVANDLIVSGEVDLMLVASTPETTNPVADQCEVNETPCLSTVAPWQPWFFTRGVFWGLEDVIAVFIGMGGQLQTNKLVGGLFPNDGDGNAWGDAQRGFPPVLQTQGYKLLDPGRYQNLTDDFSAQIAAFRDGGAEIVTGVVIPPDFTTFWNQARQKGFRPKAASVGKALLFPVAVEALGDAGHNLSSEVWWSPNHPFKSSLTGASASELAKAYTATAKKQWTQPIGFGHALFEVAAATVKAAGGADRKALRDTVAKLKVETIVGPLDWTKGPVRNVAKTPLVSGQWRRPPRRFRSPVRSSRSRAEPHPSFGGPARVNATAPPLLELEHVSKSFGALKVTDDLSFTLALGEALGVLGPNGAGKSTMFNLVTGDARPDAGRVLFGGQEITPLPPHARCRAGIGRSYQIPHPFAKLTVFENLLVGATFGGRRASGNDADALCVDILGRTALLPKANALAGSLTLLERKRLELARALATRPRLLLLDEIAGSMRAAPPSSGSSTSSTRCSPSSAGSSC